MLTEVEAIHLLNKGEVVAIPTETVYGLAARIDNEKALLEIFRVKERPFFDPLIVHVKSAEQARDYCEGWGDIHQKLAEMFWPGPLTLVVKKNEKISDLITASLPTVGMRCPRHKVTLSLLNHLDVPLAAPSANKFTKTSPTSAEHVRRSLPGVPVLDGGECEVGIESTIVEIKRIENAGYAMALLRPGMISYSEIKKAVSNFNVRHSQPDPNQIMPGNLEDHYMPEIPLVLLKDAALSDREVLSRTSSILNIKAEVVVEIHLPQEPWLAARVLYSELRKVEACEGKILLVRQRDFMETELWAAILDRIKKASRLVL